MQKTNIKASILIWATFLSLIITVLFIGISTKINKNLKQNSLLTQEFKTNQQKNNIINKAIIDGNFDNKYLDNGDKIVFEPSNQKIISIKKGETLTGKILTDSTITIKILNGGSIKYKYKTSSGIISNTGNFSENSNNTGSFLITNLGGYSKLLISSDSNKNYLSQYKNYTIYKQIGNKEVIKERGKIKNF